MANTAQLNFLDKIILSFQRGRTNPLADIAVHEAIETDGDILAALNVRKSMYAEQALTPIEGNLFSDLLYSSSNTVGQMFETAKRGGLGAAIGAGIGGVLGGLTGLIIPTVGEEAITTGLGIKLGAKLGGMVAGASFAYKQGRGGMFSSMIDQGANVEAANRISKIAAIPYASVEALQLATLAKPISRGLFAQVPSEIGESIAKRIAKTYGSTLLKEMTEEGVQEIIQIAAEETAKHYSGMGVRLDPEMLANHANRVYSTMGQALKGFALLPLPGAIFEGVVAQSSAQMQAEIEAIKSGNAAAETINIEEIDDPTIRLHYSLKDTLQRTLETSQEAIEKQAEFRKKEVAERGGLLHEWRTTSDLDWWKKARKELQDKGKYHWEIIDPLKNTLPIEIYNRLQEEIRNPLNDLNDFEAANFSKAFYDLYADGKPLRDFEIKYAKRQWGVDIANLLEALSNSDKVLQESWTDYANLPRALSASMDLSRTLRQNILLVGSPKTWGKAVATDIKLLMQDEQTARLLEKSDLTSEWGSRALKAGLRWNDWGVGIDWTRGTERFASAVARRIPGVRRSERAYSMGGNHIRMMKFSEVAQHWKETGYAATEKDYRDLAHVVNLLTGEGDPKMFGRLLPAMNAIFFAPRLTYARIRAITDLFNPAVSGAARKVLAWELVKSSGILMSFMAMAAQLPKLYPEEDIEVIGDPQDWFNEDFWKNKEYLKTDFGKIRWGNQRFDLFGGYLPLVRTVLRLATRKTVSQMGEEYPVHWTEPITQFLQQKLAPAPALALDLIKRETYRGEPIGIDPDSFANQFYNRMTPFFIQDTIDALRYQGFTGAGFAAPMAFFGAGVATYPSSPGTELLRKKNSLSVEQLGQSWNDLGPRMQEFLRRQNPIIGEWEREASGKYQGTGYLERIERDRKNTRKRIFKRLPEDVKKELTFLNIEPGAVSRNISHNWRLNHSRFKQYEMEVSSAYAEQLARLIRSNWWPTVPVQQRVNLLTKVMDRIKQAARNKIIAQANYEDFQELR